MFRSIIRLSSPAVAGLATIGSLHSVMVSKKAFCSSSKGVVPPFTSQPIALTEKVVLITGASAGIGMACAWQFAEKGSKLVLVSRRLDRLESLRKDLLRFYPQLQVHLVAMSVTDFEQVAALPNVLPDAYKEVDILINNAGLALGVTSAEDNVVADAKTVIDTNVMGVIAFSSAFLPGMKNRGKGHVIYIGSCAGHHAYATGSVYNASKFAVNGFSLAARHDLAGTPIRITHLSPGLVSNTEFSNVRLNDSEKAKLVYANLLALRPEDVADNVIYAATRPAHVQIADIVMYCTNQSGPRDIVRAGENMGAVP